MIFIVDKPAGMTSHAVVAKIKRCVGKSLRIGHTGTLDPMCTGVLPILTGQDTKLSDLFCTDKRYTAGIRFGIQTDTQDSTGTVLSQTDCSVDTNAILNVLPKFVGTQQQVPPMYSAVKINGKKLYELARQGIEVARKPRCIKVYGIQLLSQTGVNSFLLDITCSKGTYIRTLCADMGAELGVGAVMESLHRTQSNGFTLAQAHSLEAVLALAQAGALKQISISPEDALSAYEKVNIPQNGLKYFLNGGTIDFCRIGFSPAQGELFRAYSDGMFLGLCRSVQDGVKSAWIRGEDE